MGPLQDSYIGCESYVSADCVVMSCVWSWNVLDDECNDPCGHCNSHMGKNYLTILEHSLVVWTWASLLQVNPYCKVLTLSMDLPLYNHSGTGEKFDMGTYFVVLLMGF